MLLDTPLRNRSVRSRSIGWGALGGGSVGIRRARTHDARKPARLREGIEHQDQEDRKRCRKERAWSAEQPRPEEKPDEQNRRRDAQAPSHQHRRDRVLGKYVDDRNPRDDQERTGGSVLCKG